MTFPRKPHLPCSILLSRGVFRIFSSGVDYASFRKFFHQKQNLARRAIFFFCFPPPPKKKKSFSQGHNRQEGWVGAEYLNITKDRLVLASAPYAHYESFFHQGLKHTNSNTIKHEKLWCYSKYVSSNSKDCSGIWSADTQISFCY